MNTTAADSELFLADWVPVEVRFPDPGRQRRWTILLRSLLVIPQTIVVLLLGLAAELVVIVGWFAALVLGRLPAGIARFLANVVRYQTRVAAYAWLLLDTYPPFGFERPYPVAVEIEPTRLNRASVFFRLLLAIPAWLVASILAIGVWLAGFPIWLIVLVMGRMPRPLYQASAATIRFQVRCSAYVLLLTSAYPRRLFGDHELELSRGAKSMVGVFLALGLAAYVGSGLLVRQARNAVRLENSVIDDYNVVGATAKRFQTAVLKCQDQKPVLACTQAAIPAVVVSLDRFRAQLRATRFPAGAQADALRLEAAVTSMSNGFRRMEAARTTTAFAAVAIGAAEAGIEVDRRTHRLVNDLP
jgi:hypothetical protein